MSQPKENSEFRDVHAARAALAAYIASGRNPVLLHGLAVKRTQRYDVWQCVFEKEREALRFLQEQELIDMLTQDYIGRGFTTEGGNKPEIFKESVATLCICRFEQMMEWDSPLPLKDAIQIALDCLGDDFLPFLVHEAEHSLERRKSIVAKYFKPDNEWVGYSQKVVDELRKIK